MKTTGERKNEKKGVKDANPELFSYHFKQFSGLSFVTSSRHLLTPRK